MFTETQAGTHTVTCAFAGDPYTEDAGSRATKWGAGSRPWWPGRLVPDVFLRLNAYSCVSSFRPDPETGRRYRRKQHFAAMHAVMIDDIGTKVPLENLKLKPSALIETSPGNFQAYLFLSQDSFTRNRTTCEALVDSMVAAGLTLDGKDPGMKGVTRFGRLPCGINAKEKYIKLLGTAFPVHCVEFEPHLRYSLADIALAYGLALTSPTSERERRTIPAAAALSAAEEAFEAVLQFFKDLEMYRGKNSGGWHEVQCPWEDDHTSITATGTALSGPTEENDWGGGFHCCHGHCEGKGIREVWEWIEIYLELNPPQESGDVSLFEQY